MRAWQVKELGNPADVLELNEIPDPPDLQSGEVQVSIQSVGISFPDVLQCRGEYQIKPSLPWVPGGESAGVITAIANDVKDFGIGDRVMMLGGGLVEKVNTSSFGLWKIPENFAFEKAAAVPVNYGTTWFALHERASLQAGETLLITGAAGGTGSAAIQLGKAAGAKIIAIAGGEEKVEQTLRLGADHAIDHQSTPDWVDEVRALSDGGVDVAYDPVGGETTHQVRRCMAWDGRLLIIGFVAGIPDLPANHMLLKNYSVVGVHWGASLGRNPASLSNQMVSVLDLAESGAVDPLIFPPYEFGEGAIAIQDLADRKTWGKVIVRVG
ncbi:MAG: NADPH:quinone oxidoreductase family protein [Acidimicrobiales bacterium]|jgi:NADPH2:quinone reductase|nr:NADPH:quinone oxidoreductase family protein [Acidimicrobiales bacterium]HJM28430.1 NADPH:quinone oxidoreductase family protein [Acidimicrobiales bacterium]HJM97644.1 NADPH:quinone oxidoreductase family protein [Acidimicrobiales bacterium]